MTMANCPFHSVAETYTALVCGMNLDLIHGLLDTLEPAQLHAALDPSPGRCCVIVSSAST
jgi:predicted ArsR family transcriptional regulator